MFENISEFKNSDLYVPWSHVNQMAKMGRGRFGDLMICIDIDVFKNEKLKLFSKKDDKYRVLVVRNAENPTFNDCKRLKDDFMDAFKKNASLMKRFGFEIIGYEQYQYHGLIISKFCMDRISRPTYCQVLSFNEEEIIMKDTYTPIQALYEISKTHFELLPSRFRDAVVNNEI